MRIEAPLPRVNADFLVRPRLLEILDEWSPMTLLLAPSGAGKAVLAVQWAAHARAAGEDVLWVDGEVDEPAEVVAALARHVGATADADIATTLRRLRRDLWGLERRLAVVINNAEPIIEAIGDALVEIVRDCRQVHLVACLRRRVDPVAKALLEAETRVIGLSDLQFTAEEVEALAHRHGLALSPDEAEAIRVSVGGWSALVRTGLESVPGAEQRPVAAWSPRHVGWFLTVNIVPVLPPSGLDALCRTALVEDPTYGAVLAATGPLDEPARIALESLGILDPLVSEGEPLVRLPPLMRDFFRGRYDESRLGPQTDVHDRVVRFWLEAPEPRRALRQAVHGHRWTLAVEIAEQWWWEVLGPDLAEIPAAEVRGHPRVEVARQVVLPDDVTPSSPATRAWASDLRAMTPEEVADRAGDTDVLAMLALLMVRDRTRGDHDSALELASRVEAIARPAGGDRGRVAPWMAYAAREAGRTHLVSGELVAAARMLELAEDTSDDLALAAVLLGDRAATAYWLDHRSSRTEAWIPDVFDAVHSLDRDRAEQSLLELRSRWTGAETWWPLAAWAAAEHALVWRGRSRMLAELATARGSAARRRDTPWLHGLLVAAEANLATSLGRTAVAGRLLADVQPGSVQGLLARARLERVTGRPQEALALLDAAATLADPSAVVELESLVLRAWCLDATAAGAADALAQAVEHARDSRVLLPFAHVPPAFLDRHVRAVSGLGQVVALLREAGVRSPYDLVDEPPAITPREAAVLQALARGLSLEQVGRELFVSRNTVKSQVASLYRKLQVSGRTEAVRKARRMGLLD